MRFDSSHFEAVKRFYAKHLADIARDGSAWGIDPYEWEEVGIRLTPIEASIWHDIRAEGAILYPQFPVAGYFVDFGNPVARVALECDGKAYHQDQARDELRQRRIEAKGWTVYRITGSDCVRRDQYVSDDNGRDRLHIGPARALIRQIVASHGCGWRQAA